MSYFKTCARCQTSKPIEDFSVRKTGPSAGLRHNICKGCKAAQARAWYQANKERALANRRRLQLDADFGITPEEYAAMLEAQGGVCATCGRPETTEQAGTLVRLSVDHCHTTGKVRGLLCHACNRSIGLFGEDVALMERAIEYLERHLAADHAGTG